MGNYEELKQAVSNVIKTNGNQDITGQIMQNALLTIISTIGDNATFTGIATPNTNPGTPDQNVFYLASKNGTYNNFGRIALTDEVAILKNINGSWVKIETGIANAAKLAEKQDKLSFDETPTAESLNPVTSGGVRAALNMQKQEVDEAKEQALQAIDDKENEAIGNFSAQRVTPEMLSESTKQLIEASGGGTITNLADDEDLESVDDGTGSNVIKFKDKTYNASQFSGLGRKYLRKNIIQGKNILTQEMINQENTIYIIQYDYDLNGAEINIPNNCILQFKGGSFSNGKLNGINIIIKSEPYYILKNIELKGEWKTEKCYSEWFGAIGNGVSDDTSYLQKALNCFKYVELLSGRKYKTTTTIKTNYRNSLIGNYDTEIISDGDFSIILLGSHSTVKNIRFHIPKPQVVFSITSNWLSESFKNSYQGNDYWRYTTAVGITVSDIEIHSDDISKNYDVNCIESLSNGIGTGYWQILFTNIRIWGRYKYGIYLNNGLSVNAENHTWQTDMSFRDIKMYHHINGIYIGKDDKKTLDETGFPPERITFDAVSVQASGDGYTERYAVINAGNRISFINCEPWDWQSAKYKQFLINPNKTAGVLIKGVGNTRGLFVELTEDVTSVNGVPYNIDTFTNNPQQANYDLSFIFSSDRINKGTTITKQEVFNLPSGIYAIPLDTKWNKFLKVQGFNNVGFSNSILSIKRYQGGSALLELFTSNRSSIFKNMSSYAYNFVLRTSDMNEEIDDWYISQPLISVFNSDEDFLAKNYKYGFVGLIGKTTGSGLYIKGADNTILDALGYKKAKLFGATKDLPTDLRSAFDRGKQFFDTTRNKPYFYNGKNWVDSRGIVNTIYESGTFAQKPLASNGIPNGFSYFCTDKKTTEGNINGIMIYHKGSDVWVDALGRIVK